VMNSRERGHEVVAASPSSGVNTVTGEGLAQALAGAQVVAALGPAHGPAVFLGRAEGCPGRAPAARRRRQATAMVRGTALLRLPLPQRLRPGRPDHRGCGPPSADVRDRAERAQRGSADVGPLDTRALERPARRDDPQRARTGVPAYQRRLRGASLPLWLHRACVGRCRHRLAQTANFSRAEPRDIGGTT
jgi:hypothetical protein